MSTIWVISISSLATGSKANMYFDHRAHSLQESDERNGFRVTFSHARFCVDQPVFVYIFQKDFNRGLKMILHCRGMLNRCWCTPMNQ